MAAVYIIPAKDMISSDSINMCQNRVEEDINILFVVLMPQHSSSRVCWCYRYMILALHGVNLKFIAHLSTNSYNSLSLDGAIKTALCSICKM